MAEGSSLTEVDVGKAEGSLGKGVAMVGGGIEARKGRENQK